jgi:hypothetical protein
VSTSVDRSTVRTNLGGSYHSQRSGTHVFYCAQLDGEETKNKVDDMKKRRARMKMDRFKCSGWLRVTVDGDGDGQDTIRVRLTHALPHQKYTDISLPEATTKIIEEMKDSPAAKVREQS